MPLLGVEVSTQEHEARLGLFLFIGVRIVVIGTLMRLFT
jgi:hypothetical protein